MFSRAFLLARSAANQTTLADAITNLGSISFDTSAATPSNSNILTFGSVTNIFAGFTAAATGIPSGDTVAVVNGGTVNTVAIENNVTANVTNGATVTFSTTGTTGALVNSGSVIGLSSSVADLSQHMTVAGSNITGGSTIATIGANNITLSATIAGSVAAAEVLTFSFAQATTGSTVPGANILTFGSGDVEQLAEGMSVSSGTLFPTGLTIENISTISNNITLTGNAIHNVTSGAAISFGSPEFTGFNVTPYANALNDTQTVLHVDLDANTNQTTSKLAGTGLYTLGSLIASSLQESSGYTTTLQSASVLGSKIGVDLIVDI
jgi:hypothetical protein